MSVIEKELLIGRVQYLEEISQKPGSEGLNPVVPTKVKEMIKSGELTSFMQVESVFNYLKDKISKDNTEVDRYAEEILDFIS